MQFGDIDLSVLFNKDLSHSEIHSMFEEAPMVAKGDIIYLGSSLPKKEEPEDVIAGVLNDSKRYSNEQTTINLQ